MKHPSSASQMRPNAPVEHGMSTRRPSAKVLAALEHHQAGRLPQAHRGYTEALREDPDDFHAHHFMGVLMHQGGHHQQARAHLEQALAASLSGMIQYYYYYDESHFSPNMQILMPP